MNNPVVAERRRSQGWKLYALMFLPAALFIGTASQALQEREAVETTNQSFSRFTTDNAFNGEPAWSPDGKFVAYTSDRAGNLDIWIQPVGGGNPTQLTTSPANDWEPNWSPDGKQIVFRSERDGGGLYVASVAGGPDRKISPFGYRPRWSPTGSQILFQSAAAFLRTASEPPKVYSVALDGTPPHEILGEFQNFDDVEWHPDGARVSFSGCHQKLGCGFWTVPYAGGTPVKSELTSDVKKQLAGGMSGDFVWEPSGQALYALRSSWGEWGLWKVKVDPKTLELSGAERLATSPEHNAALAAIAISPDGKEIAVTTRVRHTRIMLLSLDSASGRLSGTARPLTSEDEEAWSPDLTHDGKKLAFIAIKEGRGELREEHLEVGRETPLSNDNMGRFFPRWSPDGAQLAYRRQSSPQVFQTMSLREGSSLEQPLLPATDWASHVTISDWSPDGKWLLVSKRGAQNSYEIWLLPSSRESDIEKNMRLVTSNPEFNLWQPRFSPDGRWIAFNAVKRSGPTVSTICVVPAAGGEWVRVTEGISWDDKPRWSADGKMIYFISSRGGFLNVWGIRFDPLDGKPMGKPIQVTMFDGPKETILENIAVLEISLAKDRLVLPLTNVTENVWVLEKVRR